MSEQYQVLARKYRPKTFSELIGQDHVSCAIANAIDTDRLHHAYLFTGTRGVGKTTIARLLAKCLNCETGVTSQPCGVCTTCQAIDKGQFIDLIEIDAASRTKVEDTRELLENVPYAPVQGRYKVYLIDEVHMLSTHSFNALLKTLEEPPEHIKFLFATTDPQKLPVTIISRCLQFVLRPLSQALLSSHIATILTKENIPFVESALWQIAGSAKGSVRDALSLTDQAIAFGGNQIGKNTVSEMLGLIDSVDILALIEDCYMDNRDNVANTISLMRQKLVDAPAVLEKLIDSIHQMAMVQILPNLPLDMNENDKVRLIKLSSIITSETLQLYYEVLIKSKDGLRFANTPMQGLEMAILRLLAFRPLSVYQTIEQANIDDIANLNSAAELANDDFNNEDIVSHTIQKFDDNNPENTTAIHKITIEKTDDFDNKNGDGSAIIDNGITETEENFQEYYSLEYQRIHNDVCDIVEEENVNELTQTFQPETINNIDNSDIGKEPIEQSADSKYLTVNYRSDGAISQNKELIANTIYSLPNITNLQQELYPKTCELIGEWTDDRWDYWTHLAYQNGLIGADEFAMVQNSIVTGRIKGQATLKVSAIQYQIEVSFASFKEKILAALGTEIALKEEVIDENQTPHARHQLRLIQVKQKAEQELIESPVMAMLGRGGFLERGEILTNLRLSFG